MPGAGIEPARPLGSPGILRTSRPSRNGPKPRCSRPFLVLTSWLELAHDGLGLTLAGTPVGTPIEAAHPHRGGVPGGRERAIPPRHAALYTGRPRNSQRPLPTSSARSAGALPRLDEYLCEERRTVGSSSNANPGQVVVALDVRFVTGAAQPPVHHGFRGVVPRGDVLRRAC